MAIGKFSQGKPVAEPAKMVSRVKKTQQTPEVCRHFAHTHTRAHLTNVPSDSLKAVRKNGWRDDDAGLTAVFQDKIYVCHVSSAVSKFVFVYHISSTWDDSWLRYGGISIFKILTSAILD